MRALIGTAGVAAVAGFIRAIYVVATERGPRRRVEAIKAANDALISFVATDNADDALRNFLKHQRDRELAALGRTMERIERRSRFRAQIGSAPRQKKIVVAAAVLSILAFSGLVVLAGRGSQLGVRIDEPIAWVLTLTTSIVTAGFLSAVAGFVRQKRRARPSAVFADWGREWGLSAEQVQYAAELWQSEERPSASTNDSPE